MKVRIISFVENVIRVMNFAENASKMLLTVTESMSFAKI
jgi:hypothetical protein